MATPAELQTLLRFLSQDAKVPLPLAISKVKDLQKSQLSSVDAIAKSDAQTLQAIFTEEKRSKQILAAAKRVFKKRARGDDLQEASPPVTKRKKAGDGVDLDSPAAIEASLALPSPCVDEAAISHAVLVTNRAPLVLAFAVTLLKYTMPEQPPSSRLSMAQAVVSMNSRSRAVTLGLEKGKSADEAGWGRGQPVVTIMGRDISVLKRNGYAWKSSQAPDGANSSEIAAGDKGVGQALASTRTSLSNAAGEREDPPALWGLDLEALRASNSAQVMPSHRSSHGDLPIYTAQAARTYLLKSFDAATPAGVDKANSPRPKKTSYTIIAAQRERNLGLLLGALDLLYASWAGKLGRHELDRRAWQWYVHVRPEVETGVAGWGGKGEVSLAKILDLRRKG
ncbi:MAG: hypothetical protein M1838_005930 [Thelocarpon superellum]|nr:MAG: hypothetical protein M1838_005930 [Thelocarpon superellum]